MTAIVLAALSAFLFEPGFSAKGSRVRGGFGLATSYQVIGDHRGTIAVDSERGRGTTVTVSIPARA